MENTSFNDVDPDVKSKLWDHQGKAIDFVIDRLTNGVSTCLVRMPTATGKTGVIAALVQLANQGSSLVITPWAHLRRQMVRDLKDDFWTKIGLPIPQVDVQPLFPSKAKDMVDITTRTILVATFATMNTLRLKYPEDYKTLKQKLSLVIVDECHYEPAVEWGKSVKGLQTKTVLLTATPYRNDLKLFRIGRSQSDAHHFMHRDAVAKGIVRRLSFEILGGDLKMSLLSAEFARCWTTLKTGGRLPSPEPRGIVYCSSATEIAEVVEGLTKAGIKVIGVHEQFKNTGDPKLLRDVPDPGKSDAEIWVHQHKLTEGLDDSRFCCVALFSRIRNDRKLIQQIGRVLRRRHDDVDHPAVVLAPECFGVEADWLAYLDFENRLDLLEPQHFRNIVDALLNLQPEVEYYGGKFRRRFDPAELPTNPQVVIAPSVLMRRIGPEFELGSYIEDCTDTLNIEDAVILGPDINGPCHKDGSSALWVYCSIRNSRILRGRSLYEIKLEAHCAVVEGDFLFVSDTRGVYPAEYIERFTEKLEFKELSRLLDNGFRPTHVALNSSIPYDTVIRGEDLRAHNLLSIPSSLTDRVQICRSVKGASKSLGRRYLGLDSGRLRKETSEEARSRFDYPAFRQWANTIATELKAGGSESELFQRYMRPAKLPAEVKPRTISIDLVRHDLEISLPDGRECTVVRSSANIAEGDDGSGNPIFTFTIDLEVEGTVETLELRVDYQTARKRFWFKRVSGPMVLLTAFIGENELRKTFAGFLNLNQDIVLIGLEGGELVYQGEDFYEIDYGYAERVLVDLIARPSGGSCYSTEKGTEPEIRDAKINGDTRFPASSLFRAIVDRTIGLDFDDELLVCDDLGTECADFVAANFGSRQLALLHVKVGSGLKISASSFHEVVAQAMKNLVYLTSSATPPEGVKRWSKTDKWNKTSVPRLLRTPSPTLAKQRLWKKISGDILQGSNPDLRVILVTAGCCDAAELKAAISRKKKRTPEVAQLLHLLDGLNNYARQLGVKLSIIDMPMN